MATFSETTSRLAGAARDRTRAAGRAAYGAVDAAMRKVFKAPSAEEEARLRARGAYDRPPTHQEPGRAGGLRATSSHPVADDGPDSPTEMPARSWKLVLRRTLSEYTDDECTDLAAALTYYAVLSLFPAIIAMISVLGLVGQGDEVVENSLAIMEELGAGDVLSGIEPVLRNLTTSSAVGWGLVIGLAGSLWSASGYTGAFARAMNRVYEMEEGRPVWKLRPAMLGLTALLLAMAGLMLVGFVVTGEVADAIFGVVGLGAAAQTVWAIAKWPVMLLIVIIMVALLYYLTPNVRQPRFRWVSVGAVVAILIWILASAAFGFYVGNFASYDAVYGSIAGIIVFLLWIWITNLALLFGAELDAELERARQLEHGIKAERTLQMEPRDDSGIVKKEEKEEAVVAEGRAIREASTASE